MELEGPIEGDWINFYIREGDCATLCCLGLVQTVTELSRPTIYRPQEKELGVFSLFTLFIHYFADGFSFHNYCGFPWIYFDFIYQTTPSPSRW
jgi:hypothetical protein